jgi:hypothetical protein
MKEIKLDMVLYNVPDTETEDSVWEKFIDWVESNGYTAGGIIHEYSAEELKQAEQDLEQWIRDSKVSVNPAI